MLQDGSYCPAFTRVHAVAQSEEDTHVHTALVLLLEKDLRLQQYFAQEISTGTVSVIVKLAAMFWQVACYTAASIQQCAWG